VEGHPQGEPLQVWADPDRLAEVLTNLLDNAVKYSPAGSRITVQAQRTDGQVMIVVSDEGIGIPPDELDKIFDKFHRVDRKDAKESYGHGLGLYITRKLVEAQGGQIGVESLPGQGSRFSFTLPSARIDDWS
jgi:signal transduction histidine kinase